MKIRRQSFEPDGSGSIKIEAVDLDDWWVLYNLIVPGDAVMANTVRKVSKDGRVKKSSGQIKLKLEIKVEAVDYDKEESVLRIRGKNELENDFVKIGAFHSLELELNQPFILFKEHWDAVALDVMNEAAFDSASEASIPRGKNGVTASNKFFEHVLKAFVKHVDFNVVRCAVIASPGDIKDQFYRYLLLEAERRLELKLIIKNKSRFVLAQTSSGNKHALEDVLGAPNVMNLIKDTKAAQEIRDLKDFSDMLLNDSARACYGPKHVEVAQEEYMAIQTLLITDDLFRNNADIPTRRKFAHVVKSVKDSGGTARIFSSMHVSGEQLAMYSGIAAVLRFPLPDLEHIEV
ncbi:hypothetical protein H0E87_009516 [Populus deltoides]|uniref:eRF1/Pelota-like N-terminal domain-containing protein n=1 Tax=Populus deltoides TaxID=3696 RepID=A0A8T2Z4T4_POPDE|nr:hypothetical protein H0E87_009516 [Populus deltoides]